MRKQRGVKGLGTVYEYEPNKWRCLLELEPDENGKRKRKSFSGSSQQEVVDMLQKFQAEKLKGTLVVTNKTNFYEYSNRWLKTKENTVKPTTYQSYLETCKLHFKKALGRSEMQKITTQQINNYLNSKLVSGLATATVTKHKALLHSVFHQAVQEGVIGRNPVEHAITIAHEQEDIKVINPREIVKLLRVAKVYDCRNKRQGKKSSMYLLILLAVMTGARRGELLALKWDSINLTKGLLTIKDNLVEVNGKVTIETPKTRRGKRTIAIDTKVLEELAKAKETSESSWIFSTRSGGYLMPSNVSRSFISIRKNAKLNITLHGLRHTHATLLISKGIDMKTVSERVGHEDVRTTLNLYTRALPERDREAAKMIESLLRK